jgi:hypothetical protein
MKKFQHIMVFMALIFIFVGLPSPFELAAQDTSCSFEAVGPPDVYLIVREKLAGGGGRETVVWEGWIKAYTQKSFVSNTGRVYYDYRLSTGDLTYGDNEASCEDGNIIQIP